MNLACFTSFQPSPITIDSLAVSHDHGMAAVGLSNGSIRMHELGSFALKAAIPGNSTRSVRRILFYEDKMITCGIHGTVSMWDISKCTEIASVDSSQGAIWDMVIRDNTLYLATETGSVVLVDIQDSDLRINHYWRSSSSSKTTRALSLCIESESLFVGDSSGTISRWNMKNGTCDSTFSIQTKNSLPPLIWTMVGLGNGTFATGDSFGTLSIWDATTSTLLRSRQDHQADILIMAKSLNGNELFTSGVDSRLVRYRIENQQLNMMSVGTVIQRDISALAYFSQTKNGILVGGADGRVGFVLLPPNTTSIPPATKLHRFYPCDIKVSAVGSERIFCQEHASKIAIYKSESVSATLVGEIDFGNDSIATFAVDQDGSRVVIAGVSGTCRVLSIDDDKISQLSSFKISEGIATCAALSTKNILIGTSTGSVVAVDMRKADQTHLLPATSAIKQLYISDSTSRATIVSVSGEVYSVNIAARKRKDDMVKIYRASSLVTAACNELIDNSVILALATHRIVVVDVASGVEKWSMDMPKKFRGFAVCHHINWIEYDANILTLISESCMFTLELPAAFAEGPASSEDLKLHSVTPLGGIAIGAGRLGVCESSPKKQRKASVSQKPVLVALNSYKAIHSKLVDQFERKSFQARR